MKKFMFGFLVFLPMTLWAGEIVIPDENFTVGPEEAGTCDFTSIQEALDGVLPITENIRVVTGTYNETVGIVDQSINLIGGYANCDAAESNIRLVGSMSTLDGAAHGMFINAAADGDAETVNITGFNVINGSAGFVNSGGINVLGEVTVTIQESRIAQNTGFSGGGIYAEAPASLFIQDTLVEDNEALRGGGIFCDACLLLVDGASGISDNQATGGGAVLGQGGGLYLTDSPFALILSGSSNPSANHLGVHDNVAASQGGGIYVKASQLALYGHISGMSGNDTDPVNVTSNEAGMSGGGLFITDGSLVSGTAVVISDNVTGGDGAGIDINGNSELNINLGSGTPLDDCWADDRAKCNQMRNNFIANGAEVGGQGGAIRAFDSAVEIKHVWFENNHAGEGPGAVIHHTNLFNDGLLIENSVMYQNGHPLGQDDNVIRVFSADATLRFNTLVDNNIADEVLRFVGGQDDDYLVQNTIVHNTNDDPVLSTANVGMGSPDVSFSCILVHSDASLPGDSVAVFEGDPMFFNRNAGNLHLTSNSNLAVDRCAALPGTSDVDVDFEPRHLDLPGTGNDVFNFSDIGADEYSGSDSSLDTIFADGFDGDPKS